MVNHDHSLQSPTDANAGCRNATSKDYGGRNMTLSPTPDRPSSSLASNSPRQESKLVLLGSSRVGKTALVNQYMHKTFIETYKETVEDFNWIEYENDLGEKFLMKIIDHSGSHDFVAMRDLYIETAHGFLLVCSLDRGDSVEELDALLQIIKTKNTKNASIIVAINKTDMLPSSELPVGTFLKMHLEDSVSGDKPAHSLHHRLSYDSNVMGEHVKMIADPANRPTNKHLQNGNQSELSNCDVNKNNNIDQQYKNLIKGLSQICETRGVEFVKTSAKCDSESVETAFRRIFDMMTGSDSPNESNGMRAMARSWTKRRQSTPHHALMDSVNEFNSGRRPSTDDLQRGRRSSWGVTRLFKKH